MKTSDRFGSAASLYKKHIHPRVLSDADQIARVRRLVRTGEGKKIHAALRIKTGVLCDRIESIKDLDTEVARWNHHWGVPGTAIVWGLHDVAFMGALDNDERLIAAAKRAMLSIVAADRIQGRGAKTVGYGLEPYQLLTYDLLFDRFTAAERRTIVDWVVDFCVKLTLERQRPFYMRRAGANIPMGEVLTGLMGLLMIEGDEGAPDLTAEKRELLTMFEATVNSAIGPDGYPYEDVGYGAAMGGWVAYLVEATYRSGDFDTYDRCPRFAKFARAILAFVQPWGKNLSNTGDAGDDFTQRSFVLAKLAARTNDPSIEWLRRTLYYPSARAFPCGPDPATYGETKISKDEQIPVCAFSLITLGEPPRAKHPRFCGVPTQFVDRGRGIVTLRSSWKDDAALVVFDGAQRSSAATGHDHASGGHFSLSALGEYFGIDTGRYNIDQDQHNVVLINGKSGHPTNGEWRFTHEQAVLIGQTSGVFVDTASADTSHQSNCVWARRTVGLVKGDRPYAWTVEDVNADHGARGVSEYWWTLNTHPDNKIKLAKDHATVQGCRHGNLLDVHFAMPSKHAFPTGPHTLKFAQNLQTCGSYNYIKDIKGSADAYRKLTGDMVHGPVYERPRLVAKITGFNGRFMSIMLPRLKGEKPALVRRLDGLDNTLGVSITWDNFEDTLIWAYEHRMLEGNGVSARGQWCVVRRAMSKGKRGRVIDYAVGDGNRIEVDGNVLKLRG